MTPATASTVAAENIFGTGSSLQGIAMTDQGTTGAASTGGYPGCATTGWLGWVGVWDCSGVNGLTNYQTTLSNRSVATYTVESSGVGLAEFGNQASGSCTSTTAVLSPACDPTADAAGNGGTPELDAWIGTDDPPNSAQLTDAATAAGAGVHEVTLPVAQAPVALLLSLPTDITLPGSAQVKLTSQAVADVYSQTVPAETACTSIDSTDAGNTWCDLLVEAGWTPITSGSPTGTQFRDGSDDGGPIILQARSKGSGTTFSLRGYLYELDGYGLTTKYPYPLVTDGPDDWPVTTTQTGNTSGGALVADTTATPGSFGYADLADAATASPGYALVARTTTTGGTHQILYVKVQDNTSDATPYYAAPGNTTGGVNLYTGTAIGQNVTTCSAPSTARVVGCWGVPSTATGAWSSTNAATPGTIPSDADVYDHGTSSTGTPSHAYPIAAATYDVFWTDYDNGASNLDSNHYYDDPSCPASTNCNTDAGQAAKSFAAFLTGAGQGRLAQSRVYYAQISIPIRTKAQSFAKSVTP